MAERVRDLIWRSGLSRPELARRLGVSLRTLRSYADDDRAPVPVRALLEIYAGRVPWPGGDTLRCERGVLYHDTLAVGVPLAEIPAYHWRLRELEALRRELAETRATPAQYLLKFS